METGSADDGAPWAAVIGLPDDEGEIERVLDNYAREGDKVVRMDERGRAVATGGSLQVVMRR